MYTINQLSKMNRQKQIFQKHNYCVKKYFTAYLSAVSS